MQVGGTGIWTIVMICIFSTLKTHVITIPRIHSQGQCIGPDQ
jgi:hypothetical protein